MVEFLRAGPCAGSVTEARPPQWSGNVLQTFIPQLLQLGMSTRRTVLWVLTPPAHVLLAKESVTPPRVMQAEACAPPARLRAQEPQVWYQCLQQSLGSGVLSILPSSRVCICDGDEVKLRYFNCLGKVQVDII